MPAFEAKQINYEYIQTNDAPPDKVFPLLCPVREAEWVPGWQCRLIYSSSGVAEDGCVFTTPNDQGPETVWMVTHYDPDNYEIAYAWVKPGTIATQLRITLASAPGGMTRAHIRYCYTGLSQAGNVELDVYTPKWFREKMQGWEMAINHFLRNGTLIQTTGRE